MIGSKRHPESLVHYPRSRRIRSWLYQQVVRLLPARRPRHAGRAQGLPPRGRRGGPAAAPRQAVRVRPGVPGRGPLARLRQDPGATCEARVPVHGLGRAVAGRSARARRHPCDLLQAPDPRLLPPQARLLPAYARTQDFRPRVSLVAQPAASSTPTLIQRDTSTPEDRAAALAEADGEVVAFLERDAAPAANWLAASISFLSNPRIAAVVTPRLAPAQG